MAVTQYIGARYVPLIMGEWDGSQAYEPLSVVIHEGNSFTSVQDVPKGIDILDEEYWVETGNYNAQVEAYRREVLGFEDQIDTAVKDAADAKSQVAAASQAASDASAKAESASAAAKTADTKAGQATALANEAKTAVETEKTRATGVESTAVKSLAITSNTLTATTIGGKTTTIGKVGDTSDFLHEWGVLCLGDSFGSESDKIAGRGYWPTYLRNQIKTDTGMSDIPFYNYCVSGYGFNNVAAAANDQTALNCTVTGAHSFYQAAVTAATTLKATSYNGQNVAANIGHVIIFGGYNDVDRMPNIMAQSPEGGALRNLWKSNVKNTIERIHTDFPRATIHLIPFNWPAKAVSSKNIKYMVEEVAKATYDSRLSIMSYYSPLAEVASQYTYCDLVPYAWTWLLGEDSFISADALHPNAYGAQVIASYINSAFHGYTPTATRSQYVKLGDSYGVYMTMNGNTVTAELATLVSSYSQPTELPAWVFGCRAVALFAYVGSVPGQTSVIRPAMLFFASEDETFKTWDSSTSSEFITGGNYGMCYASGTWQIG